MDRLTMQNYDYADCEFMDSGIAPVYNRLAAYEDTGLEPSEINFILGEYERFTKLEREGRLITLPCKVWDVVYAIEPGLCDLRDVDACSAYCDGWDFSCPDYHSNRFVIPRHFQIGDVRCFGETVFLTREEAEAALGGDGDAET